MKKSLVITICVIAALVAVRIALEPSEHPPPFREFKPLELEHARAELPLALQNIHDLGVQLQSQRVILVGEEHFYIEPQQFLTNLLELLNDSSIVVLLELSEDSQDAIDAYLQTGDEARLEPIWRKSNNLPYRLIVQWAFKNKSRVRKVVAFDQNFSRVGLNRLLLTDTRNQTMADAIYTAFVDYPKARIVAYGGQMHMTMAGRYRYDNDSRIPAGARLVQLGIPRSQICSIMLSGRTTFPLDSIWKTPGAILARNELGKLPYEYFINYPIFGAQQAGELFDIFVNLGELTEISRTNN
ncbi:MAG: hypothetical protein HY089_10060 [Ignavibacteriales bacterium]|nr:hypothetical protein [Bacteroidota bacterium]MBI3579740.1 hypothetical protein [Ignavibacteriales bacterium]